MEKKNEEIKRNAAMGASASVGAAAGVVGGSLFTGELRAEEVHGEEEPKKESGKQEEEAVVINSHDDEIKMATTVNNDMSFSEAFAAARAEVGPGGAFEWRGGLYGTYYAEEWNNMTAEQKAEYYSHFNWGSGHHGGHETPEPKPEPAPEPEPPTPEPPTPEPPTAEHKIEVISGATVTGDSGRKMDIAHVKIDGFEAGMVDIDRDGKVDFLIVDVNDNGEIEDDEIHYVNGQGYDMPSIEYAEQKLEPEIEVLSVETVTDDEGNQMDVAQVTVNGHEGIIADFNRDGMADVLVVDANDNGKIEDNERIDIRDMEVDMASLVPQSQYMSDNVLYAQNDPDYINDANVDDYFS